MNAKESNVKMRAGAEVREFPFEQAERLLTMNLRGGTEWSLDDDDYEFVEGHLVKKAAKKADKKKEDNE